MKVLALLVSAVTSIGLAIPAHADPGDDAFLAALTKAGITYKAPDRAIKAGQKVCDLANSGTSELDIIRDVHDLNPAFSMANAAKFAQAAASAYCPELLTAGSPNPDDGGPNPDDGGPKPDGGTRDKNLLPGAPAVGGI